MRKVVVTGMGAITPIGNSVETYWENLINGVSGISRITRFNPELFRCQVAGEIVNFKLDDYFDEKEISFIRKADPGIQYGLGAAKMALDDAGITETDLEKEEWGIILGQTIGGSITGEASIVNIIKNRKLHEDDHLYLASTIGSVLHWFNRTFNVAGFGDTISTGCAAGTDAIGQGFHMIRDGFMDIAMVGGMEAPIAPLTLAAFDVIGALANNKTEPTKASCPFSQDRTGFVAAEGAGILIIEELRHAERRGAKIYGEIIGYGNNSNAFHMTAPAPEGETLGEAMLEAIKDAGISKEEIGYINAHGSSTPLNDIAETKAIKYAFGDYAREISISSTKSMIGHPLGAAGALELIATILAVKNGIIPPTINLINPDPECDLDYTPNIARKRSLKYAMSNSSGFGGVNCSIIFGHI